MKIRKDDNVMVMTGDDAGTTGRVLRVLPDKRKIVVEGVNKVYKHVRPNRRNPQGGRLSRKWRSTRRTCKWSAEAAASRSASAGATLLRAARNAIARTAARQLACR